MIDEEYVPTPAYPWPRFCTVLDMVSGKRGRLEYRKPGESYVRWFECGASPGFAGEWLPNSSLDRYVPTEGECVHGMDPDRCEACAYENGILP